MANKNKVILNLHEDLKHHTSHWLFSCKHQTFRVLLIAVVFWGVFMIISDISEFSCLKPTKKTQCTSVDNVIFLKTHKTGSTTIANVMYRYSKSNRLKVALPGCDHRFCFPYKFTENFLYNHKVNDTYNMLFHHAVFHKQNMIKILDKGNTKIVTILREPYSQFDSAAQYLNFRINYKLSGESPVLDELFKMSDEDLTAYIKSQKFDGYGAYSLTKNPNAFDMGFDPWNETSEYIKTVLKTIEDDFNLVMITEYMAESLVLLKNELCWDFKDIAFFHHNARLTKEINTNHVQNIKQRVLNWNKLDVAIYDYFNKTFWEKIKNSDNSFKSDVEKLKKFNYLSQQECATLLNNATVTQTATLLLSDFKIAQNFEDFCSDLLIDEVLFTNVLKKAKDKNL
ncbi:galactose-3-O-sulfotransferase 3 isoform X2 [Hydra vulgaris]|uniref:Galactose-3-O-sulfotransferase 3 isoform X2 n=2 Tax=Hydra vulgaris TaxID=6087 RepID=A0ABM4CE14_HYDVU